MNQSEVEEIRRLFPVTRQCIYFNHAGTGPLPETAVRAVTAYATRAAEEGEVPYEDAEAMVEDCRSTLARLLKVPADTIAFTSNTTTGIILAINSVDWHPGDNVILMQDDFPTVTYPFRLMLPGVQIRWVESAALVKSPEVIADLVDRRTRMVAVSWVHFLSGRAFDIRTICRFCRERGVVSVIDAIQGMGVVDFDWSTLDADFVTGHGAKWLLSPQGTGIVLTRSETLARLRPVSLGWLSCDWRDFNDIFLQKPLKSGTARLEAGTKNYLGIAGMSASLKLFEQVGVPAIEARIRNLCLRLRTRLEAAGFEVITPKERERSAGIITCHKPGVESARIHGWLRGAKMVCALRQNLLRIAPHCYNTEAEVDSFLERACAPEATTAPRSDCKI